MIGALEDQERAYKIDPKNLNTLIARSIYFRKLQDYNKALGSANQIIKNYPDKHNGYLTRLKIKILMKDYDSAISDLGIAREKGMEEHIYRSELGKTYILQKQYAAAIKELNKAIGLADQRADFYDLRSSAYAEMGKFGSAIADNTTSISLEPNNPDYYNSRCWHRAINEQMPHAAISDCNFAISSRPKIGAFINSRALVYYKLAKLNESEQDYTKAISFDPKDAGSLYMRGLVRRRQGDELAGFRDINAAIAINPDVANVYKKFGFY